MSDTSATRPAPKPAPIEVVLRGEVTLNVNFSGPVTLNVNIQAPIPLGPGPATKAVLTLQGANMPGQITVDTTNETVTVSFLDDKGDVATAPAGAVVAFTSDTPTVATVAADATNPLVGDITPVGEGVANIGATITGATEADGVTPFPVPAPVAVTVSAGAAASDALTLSV